MKNILILLSVIFLFVSCGKTENDGIEKMVGVNREFSQVVIDGDTASRLQAMCQAISFKSDLISSQIGRSMNFNFSTKSCSDKIMGNSSVVQTTIDQQTGRFVFKKTTGSLFEFPEVETLQSGVFSSLCQDVMNLKSPMKTSATGAMWISAPLSNSVCQSDTNNYCLVIERGSEGASGIYNIHTTEVLKVKLNNPDRGFIVLREVQSTSYCQSPDFLIMRASI